VKFSSEISTLIGWGFWVKASLYLTPSIIASVPSILGATSCITKYVFNFNNNILYNRVLAKLNNLG